MLHGVLLRWKDLVQEALNRARQRRTAAAWLRCPALQLLLHHYCKAALWQLRRVLLQNAGQQQVACCLAAAAAGAAQRRSSRLLRSGATATLGLLEAPHDGAADAQHRERGGQAFEIAHLSQCIEQALLVRPDEFIDPRVFSMC